MKCLGNIILFASLFYSCTSIKKQKCQTFVPKYEILESTISYNDGETSKTYIKKDTIYAINTIFGCGNECHYKAFYYDSTKSLIKKNNILLIGSNTPWIDQINDNQIKITYFSKYSKKDSIAFAKRLPLYQNWKQLQGEGVVENIKQVFIHPIRFNQFVTTETMAYPQIQLPALINKTWTSVLSIPEGIWGGWENSSIYSTYRISGKKHINIKNKSFDCWVIKANSVHYINKLQQNSSAEFLFNETIGFVSMSYKCASKDSIHFKMTRYTKNYK